MEDKLIELLNTFNYPVIRQGSLGPDKDYPETFFTFWNNSEYEQAAYDNETVNVVYDFNVNVYSTDPATAYNLLAEARQLLKDNSFIILTRGYDVPSDENTHSGRGMDVYGNSLIKQTAISYDAAILESLNKIILLQNETQNILSEYISKS